MKKTAISVFSAFKRLRFPVAGLAPIFFLSGPPQPASAQSTPTVGPAFNPLAWAPAAIANSQKMHSLFPDIDIATQISPIVIPKFESNPDPSGLIATDQAGGPTFPPLNAFFQNLGTNGRTCFTCHQPQTGWTVSAANVQTRFNLGLGTDPIFRLVDGATCPSDNVQNVAAKLNAYQLLLSKGLIRIGLSLPAGAQFTVAIQNDLYNCSNNSKIGMGGIYSFYRRPLLTTNLSFQSANPANLFMWDGREPSLLHQSIDATLIHAQANTAPTANQQSQMVSFESGLFTAQDPDPARAPTVIPVFHLYTSWASLTGTSLARESVARGQALFNAERPNGACGGCHNIVDVGNNDNGSTMNFLISASPVRAEQSHPSPLLRTSTFQDCRCSPSHARHRTSRKRMRFLLSPI